MKTSDFDYVLPGDLIAQNPLLKRDDSQLMCLDRGKGTIVGRRFYELPEILRKGDVLVFNQSKVIPARILFSVEGKEVEIFLLKKLGDFRWQAMVRPGRLFREGKVLSVDDRLTVEVEHVREDGVRVLRFDYVGDNSGMDEYLESIGTAPLPPYISNSKASFDQYQTVYARDKGSVAAPTAGLHFMPDLLEKLRQNGVQLEFLTLHVGMGTFAPVKTEKVEEHKMHTEFFELTPDVAERLNLARAEGRRIIAVGTTTVRVLESCAVGGVSVEEGRSTRGDCEGGEEWRRVRGTEGGDGLIGGEGWKVGPKTGETDIFIYPGYRWKFVSAMITNFHLPKSTLLMLVSAFAGREFVLKAYREAIRQKYRFFSFGDGMLIE